MKTAVLAVFFGAAIISMPAVMSAQVPPISWSCPMHPDVVEDAKGKCPVCGMTLEPVRLVTVWKCPVHAVIEEQGPGKCRICSRQLVATNMALTWTCHGDKQPGRLEPFKCADDSTSVAKYTARPHGDHNPKHGGIFFMAADNWHHIEGTYPGPGRFRVYIYDDYSRPLPLARARKVRARVVTKEAFDAQTKTTRELASAPLVLARNGAFFEARIDRLSLPAQMTAKISFGPDVKENRFDFAFPAFSKDVPSPAAPAPPPSSSRIDTSKGVSSLLADLKTREAEVRSLVQSGNFGAIYVPALQAKDLALEIQSKAADQHGVETPVRQIVLSAYQLDNFGDLGDREKVVAASGTFSSAIAALETLIAPR